jgi:hypothetical protein
MNKSNLLFTLAMGIALIALGTGRVAAQMVVPEGGETAHMVVTEEPRQGSDGLLLSPQDVAVYQGHERDQVTRLQPAQGDRAAMEFFILLDDDSTYILGSQLADIRRFISEQPASTKIGVAYMRYGTASIAQKPTSDHDLAAKALRLPLGVSGINGSPYFSLSNLVKYWPASTGRREVLMVTDGIDGYYQSNDMFDPYLAAAIADAQRAGVVVSTIYTPGASSYGRSDWRTLWGQTYIAQVAKETGGEAYYIGFDRPAVAFAPYLNDLSKRLNHQYLLSFRAGPEKKADLEPVRVTTEESNTDLVSADQVYVPAGR